MSKKDLLTKFKTKSKEITVKAWDDEVITIRELTVSEANAVQERMTKDATETDVKSGKMHVSVPNFVAAKIMAVSIGIVNPKLTESEIETMGITASAGITEIYEAIGALNEPKK